MIKKIGWFQWLWHLLLAVIFRTGIVVYSKSNYPPGGGKDLWLEPYWLCPGCRKYRPWTFGRDQEPDLCDDCWCAKAKKKEPDADCPRPG